LRGLKDDEVEANPEFWLTFVYPKEKVYLSITGVDLARAEMWDGPASSAVAAFEFVQSAAHRRETQSRGESQSHRRDELAPACNQAFCFCFQPILACGKAPGSRKTRSSYPNRADGQLAEQG
ncbi:MAG: hypothetical protein WA717_12965, partial [Methyloceanibacter sp.]